MNEELMLALFLFSAVDEVSTANKIGKDIAAIAINAYADIGADGAIAALKMFLEMRQRGWWMDGASYDDEVYYQLLANKQIVAEWWGVAGDIPSPPAKGALRQYTDANYPATQWALAMLEAKA